MEPWHEYGVSFWDQLDILDMETLTLVHDMKPLVAWGRIETNGVLLFDSQNQFESGYSDENSLSAHSPFQ